MNLYTFIPSILFIDYFKFVKCVNQQSSFFPFGMNIRNNVMSGIQDTADFAVNIHPPHEDLEETLKSLDGIMMLENAQRRADNEEFYEAEQRLLKIHKNKIREIVSSAFEPIHSMFPSRMEAFIRNETII
ncbi:conserved hypothetical protein [Theileria orientalis strain Shintoku]|uniref:Uncharacterized protein n=1 Tax=Theileria orientalis strain Shintoku TaxID=869250 RepID=J4C912_THEOR|nr:conserved hypothetical protein [Theileria orientalis strain Shintoku]PVC53667.1 hypothetical protein MACL_00003648 [Theileria orientalis]BAM41733.1 conserved hypothetical protein [Theileria orientalis strain Shintoku]|eukprot:XP_009692034.1 conserved hypothetical protein [Theileria orientalis strain Shintoku]